MSEIVWVERNDAGAIKGVYANKQEGYAEEQLPADDPEVVAYLNPPAPAPVGPPPEATLLYDHENRLRLLEGQPPLTLEDVLTKMKEAQPRT